MAEDKKLSAIPTDPLADDLAPDPSNPPDVACIAGFVGRAAMADAVRIYLTPQFDEYVEVPRQSVRGVRRRAESSSLGGSLVYVDKLTKLRRVKMSPATEAQFLMGALASKYSRSAQPSAAFAARSTGTLRHTLAETCRTNYPTSCPDYFCHGGGGGGSGTTSIFDDECFGE